MTLYAALTLWLLVIMFSAWGVHRLWSALIKPRVVNSVLLPGTLVAQLGHVLGLLLSGNSVKNTALMDDGEEGDPKSDTPDEQRLPIKVIFKVKIGEVTMYLVDYKPPTK